MKYHNYQPIFDYEQQIDEDIFRQCRNHGLNFLLRD